MAQLKRRVAQSELSASLGTILSLRPKELWAFFKAQDLAYWAMCAYLVIEYVRPQQSVEAVRGFPLGQISLALALIGYVMRGASTFSLKGLGSYLLIAFTIVIIASSVSAFDPDASFAKIRVWYSWVAIYLLIINVVNTKQRFAFFTVLWLICHYYMSQGGARQFAMRGFTFATWGITGAPGWFENSGEFGIAMCMMAAVSWHFYIVARPYLGKWRKLFVLGMPITAVLGVIGSSSRGALLGLAAVGVYIVIRSKINPRTLVSIVVISAVGWFAVPAEQKARFSDAGEDETSIKRKVYWINGLEMAADHPVLGIGYENWLSYYRLYYRDSEASDDFGVHSVQVAHNIFIQCMAELGYTGLLVFVLLILATAYINSQTRKLVRAARGPPDPFMMHMSFALEEAMWSYVVAGFFVTVLYYPFFWINLALTVALHAVALQQQRTPASERARAQVRRPADVHRPVAQH